MVRAQHQASPLHSVPLSLHELYGFLLIPFAIFSGSIASDVGQQQSQAAWWREEED